MNRRSLLKRVGAAGIAATALGGRAAASTDDLEYGIDHDIDVAEVSGQVSLAQLLSEEELEQLNDDVDPAESIFIVDESMDTMNINDCCTICCRWVGCGACSGCCACKTTPACMPAPKQ